MIQLHPKINFCHHFSYSNGSGGGILLQLLGNVEVFLFLASIYSYPVYSYNFFLPKLCCCLNSASPFCVLIRDVFIGSLLSAFIARDKTSHLFLASFHITDFPRSGSPLQPILSPAPVWAWGPELATAAIYCLTRDFYNAINTPLFLTAMLYIYTACT